MHPLERLLNLVALLLNARIPLSFDQIRDTLQDAYRQTDRESAKRQFERDKDDLREIGIPIETEPIDILEPEMGYVIPKDRYYLPEIAFTPEEVAALFVAANLPGEDGEAADAFRKLALHADIGAVFGLAQTAAPGVDASAPHLLALGALVQGRRRVRFRYRTAQGEESERDVDAWRLVLRRGSWYLVGHDHDRGEPRSFRLTRIASEPEDLGEGAPPPEGFRAADQLAAGPWGPGEPEITATIAFGPKVAWWALAGIEGVRVRRTRDDGWVEAEMPAAWTEGFVAWVLSFGPDAILLGPEDLRAAVAARLEAVRAAL